MSDPLSITSAIVGLLTLTATTACSLYSSVKDAPASIRQIEEKSSDLHLIFCLHWQLIDGDQQEQVDSYLMATLSGCVLMCSALDKKLSDVAGLREAGVHTGTSASGQSWVAGGEN